MMDSFYERYLLLIAMHEFTYDDRFSFMTATANFGTFSYCYALVGCFPTKYMQTPPPLRSGYLDIKDA